MSSAEQPAQNQQDLRHIPDRMPRKESSAAGYALPAFAHNLDGLTLISHATYPQPTTLPHRARKRIERAPIAHTSDVVRIEHLQVSGDTVSYDSFPADWKSWSVIAPDKTLGIRPKEKRLAHLTGVSVAWITTEPDGSHKLAVQKRDVRNSTNPATYGPSASGAWDAELLEFNGKMIIKDPSAQSARANVFRETTEELGLPDTLLQDPRVSLIVSGIVEDKRKPHYDLTYFGVLPFSVAEIQKIHAAARSSDVGKEYGHGGTDGLTFIDADPMSIQKILTEVNSPLPPVSVATFLLAGYMLTMQDALKQTGNQQEALSRALAWKSETEKGIETSYKKMMRRSGVNNILTATEELVKSRSIKHAASYARKYNTKFPPHKQGLEDIDFALQEAGIEKTTSHDYLLNDLLRNGQGLESFGPDAVAKYAEIMSYIDPAVAKLHQLAHVTDVDWFSFLQRLETSDDPVVTMMYGPKESRLARLQYKIGNGFDFLKIPDSDIVVPVQAETWDQILNSRTKIIAN